jgi:hypothetical protein
MGCEPLQARILRELQHLHGSKAEYLNYIRIIPSNSSWHNVTTKVIASNSLPFSRINKERVQTIDAILTSPG